MQLPSFKPATLYPKAEIPNQAGFTLLLIHRDGYGVPATVQKDSNGCHYCHGSQGRISLADYSNWILPA